MDAAKLKGILENHALWLLGDTKGIRADLRVAYLSGADLRGANLRGADLREAYLRVADLRGADLRVAYLSGANLRVANLSGANLREADLSGADLRGADLSGANLSGADLRVANLEGADLSGANLEGADLRGANLKGIISDFKVFKTITGLTWNIVLMDDKVVVGCQSHDLNEWLTFDDGFIDEMDDRALNFYHSTLKPLLLEIYKDTGLINKGE